MSDSDSLTALFQPYRDSVPQPKLQIEERRAGKLALAEHVAQMVWRLFQSGVLTAEELVIEINAVRADLGLAALTYIEIRGVE